MDVVALEISFLETIKKYSLKGSVLKWRDVVNKEIRVEELIRIFSSSNDREERFNKFLKNFTTKDSHIDWDGNDSYNLCISELETLFSRKNEKVICPYCKKEGEKTNPFFVDRHFYNCIEKPRDIDIKILKLLQAIYLMSEASITAGDYKVEQIKRSREFYNEAIK